MLACDECFGSNELAERLSESTERPGKPRGRDAGRVQDSEAAHLNSPERALESQISMSHLVPLLEFNQERAVSRGGEKTARATPAGTGAV